MESYLAQIKNRSERKQFASLSLQRYCPHHAQKNRLIEVDALTHPASPKLGKSRVVKIGGCENPPGLDCGPKMEPCTVRQAF